MTKQRHFKVAKLVRDKFPAAIDSEYGGKSTHWRMDGEAYIKALKDKLIEESLEVEAALNDADLKEEIADVLEVLFSLLKAKNFSLEEIEHIRQDKIIKRGGFSEQFYCSAVTISDKNTARLHYYLQNSEKYPEMLLESSVEGSDK